MNLTWPGLLSIASPAIALASALFIRRSSQIARRALDLAYKTSQVTFETTKADRIPAVSLFLTEIEFRRPVARDLSGLIGAVAREWADKNDADNIEVVIRGRLLNNTDHEILLTCRDHQNSGRTVRYPYRNQSVFIIEGAEVEFGETVLSPTQEASFTWIDRRPKNDWIDIYNLHTENCFNDPERRIPQLTLLETVRAVIRRQPINWTRLNKVKRSGFRLVCEPRMEQRLTTVWQAEVVRTPLEAYRNDQGRISFDELLGSTAGPLDDRVVHYRISFDSSLANINPPRRRFLVGRF